MLVGEQSLFAENGLPTVSRQNHVANVSIKWNWSHHQFEAELCSAGSPGDLIDLVLGCFLRGSKHAADPNPAVCPILANPRGESSSTGEIGRPIAGQ